MRSKVLPKTVAKVERPEAVSNIERIVAVADAVMIGRGDLALEADPAKLDIMQKDIVAACVRAGKPVIVATQMLESMMVSPRPTRAEISDVSNAVIDHTDATMLSGETASGQYPVSVVATMAGIIHEAESSPYDDVARTNTRTPATPTDALAERVADCVRDLGVTIVLVFPPALSALSAMVRLRPEARFVPVVSDEATARPLLLSWATYPFVAPHREKIPDILRRLRAKKILHPKDKVLIVSAIPKDTASIDRCITLFSV